MATPYLGEIRLFSFPDAPSGWAPCNGQILPISGNQALFSLLGTTYGGNGQTTFALPDLQGRVPIHVGTANLLGASGGQAAVTLTVAQLPAHQHQAYASANSATAADPGNAYWAASGQPGYAPPGSGGGISLDPGAIQPVGAGQAHQNMAPYLTLTFCIATTGVFPPRPLTPGYQHARSIHRGDPPLRLRVPADRLGRLQRPAPVDRPEHGPLLAAGGQLRRRRGDHLRPARPPRAGGDPGGPGGRPVELRTRADRGGGRRHPHRRPTAGSHPRGDGVERRRHAGQPRGRPLVGPHGRARVEGLCHQPPVPRRRWPPRPSGRPGAARPTPT